MAITEQEKKIADNCISEFKSVIFDTLAEFSNSNNLSEKDLLLKVSSLPENEKDLILRNIFDNCRKYGLGLVSGRNTFKLTEIINELNLSGIDCFSGIWEEYHSKSAYRLTRSGCSYLCLNQGFACLIFREALDGLIMGCGDSERIARHKSIMYGSNDKCVDIIYESDFVDYRWGDVPLDIVIQTEPIIKKFSNKDIDLVLKGFSERTLFYQIKDKNESLKYFRHKFIIESIKKNITQKIPGIELVEISPRAVIEGEF